LPEFRFGVSVLPKAGILDPQGQAIEHSLAHLELSGIREVRVGRRVELTVAAPDAGAAEAVARRLAEQLLVNPLVETFSMEPIE
jgi:phosphoribosylformylglycinamidine synthase subunit PurS